MPEYVVEFGRDGQPIEADGRLDAAAFHRNHQPIWEVLSQFIFYATPIIYTAKTYPQSVVRVALPSTVETV